MKDNTSASVNKVVHLINLKHIVKVAKELNYNRQIDYDKIYAHLKKEMNKDRSQGVWSGDYTTVIIVPMIVHEHAQGKKVDEHMRCQLVGPHNVRAIIDIPMDIYNRLMTVETYLAEMEYSRTGVTNA